MASDQAKKMEEVIEVILCSIPKEREARDLYRQTARRAPSEMTRLLFERLAEQEETHERKLRAVLDLLRAEKKELEGRT